MALQFMGEVSTRLLPLDPQYFRGEGEVEADGSDVKALSLALKSPSKTDRIAADAGSILARWVVRCP